MAKGYFIKQDVNLKPYNTMRIDAAAASLVMPYCEEGVVEIFNNFNDVIVVGNGSNTIFSKREYQDPILVTTMLDSIKFDNGCIEAGSGVPLSRLAWFALEHHLEGFEYLEDIPGSVGGALYMNAGTNDGNIGDLVVSVTVWDYQKRELIVFDSNALSATWGYRTSFFQDHKTLILSCRLKGKGVSDDYNGILEKMLLLKRNRFVKQPRDYPNAGSVFKRPCLNGVTYYIWKLFDELGLRGFRIGDAQISEKHPGFIINRGRASGTDVLKLLDYCKTAVKIKYGLNIEEEWKIV